MGPAGGTDSLLEHKGFAPERGVCAIADGLFTGSGQSPDRFIVHRGARDRGESPRARQPGEWHGVAAGGFDPIACFLRAQRGGDDPAVGAFFHPIPREPGATRSGCIDKDQGLGLGLQLPNQSVDGTLPGAKGPQGDDLGVMIFGDVGHSDRLFVHIHADVKRARLVHG
jgi:hypothetical protein